MAFGELSSCGTQNETPQWDALFSNADVISLNVSNQMFIESEHIRS